MGAGAVGCYFGGMLARAGTPVVFIGRRSFVEAVAREGLFIDSVNFQEKVDVAASTDAAAISGADVVLFCVKTLSNAEAAKQIAPHLKPGATVVSLQNGVDNVESIRAASGVDALPAVVYVAAAMPGPARIQHNGRGDLILGHPQRKEEVARVVEMFTRARVPAKISENIEADLWTKLIMNCAGNAVSAIARATYGRIAKHELAIEVVMATVREVLAVAKASGVQVPPMDFLAAAVRLLSGDLRNATSSTAQDVARGKRTEVDSLNGFIVRRGAALGVPTPVNHTLYALVKLIEESDAGTKP